ncbi:interferon beta-like [Esox lucius]|uniref:interferon beta-like n=1 Tax=Esox lucius TaxID=8010 RepID=UPI00147740E4|nr:interferon beta-like [Esox lucius]
MALPTTVAGMSTFLLFAHVWSMPTPCHIQGTLLESAKDLLRDMGGHFPSECLQDKVNITFPARALTTSSTPTLSGSGAKTIYEILKNIDSLFGAEDLPTKWDQQKLDNFQNIIHTQIDHSKCVSGYAYSVETSDYPVRAVALKTYFGNIEAALKEKKFSYCAWEVVRKQVLETLIFILTKNSNCLLWPNRS